MNEDDLNHIYQYGPLRRQRGAREGNDVYLGKSASFVISDHRDSKEGKQRAAEITDAFNKAGQVATITQERDTARIERDKANKEVERLKAELANGGGNIGEFVKVISSGTDLYTKK